MQYLNSVQQAFLSLVPKCIVQVFFFNSTAKELNWEVIYLQKIYNEAEKCLWFLGKANEISAVLEILLAIFRTVEKKKKKNHNTE